jgi:hypothetical protein
MGEIVVNSRSVARFKFLRFDKFEARNRPHLHILVRCVKFPPIKKPAIRGGLRKAGMKQDVQEKPHLDRL